MVVANSCGSAQDQVSVYFEYCEFTIYVPNCFTPDGDGINEAWKPQVSFLKSYELKVFDRWGHMVFETRDTDEYWTGNVRGGDYFAEDGVYTYLINYVTRKNEGGSVKGFVVLIR